MMGFTLATNTETGPGEEAGCAKVAGITVPESARRFLDANRILIALESAVYVSVGLLLFGAIAQLIISVLITVVSALMHAESPPFYKLLEEVLLILMLVEIIHTVRVSLTTRALFIEPFLLVGLIASIRRLLIITLEQSAAAVEDPDLFYRLLAELGVTAGVILVLVIGIWLLRQRKRDSGIQA